MLIAESAGDCKVQGAGLNLKEITYTIHRVASVSHETGSHSPFMAWQFTDTG
ncbi:MAG TPA: hypothetical protein VK436_05220 [Methanocella sp.]|nr:hypothetical protein [Methanocella sp.]